jgi:hypothetical protein
MAFLDALGRTDALPRTVESLTNLTLGLRSLKLQEAQAAQQMQATQLQMQKAQNELETQRHEQEQLNTLVRVDDLFAQTSPQAADYLRGIGRAQGFFVSQGGQEFISLRNIKTAKAFLDARQDIVFQSGQLEIAGIGEQLQQLDQQFQTGKLKPEQQQQLLDARHALVQRQTVLAQQLAQLQGEPFTLKQGEVRLSAGGVPLAGVAAAPEAPSFGVDFNRTAQELFPGRDVWSLTGAETQQVNERLQQDRLALERQSGAGKEMAERETDVARLALFTQEGVEGIDHIVGVLNQTPEAFGASGTVAATMLGLSEQVVNMGRLFAPNLQLDAQTDQLLETIRDRSVGLVTDDQLLQRSTEPFAAHFKRVGITNRVLQSQLVGLATTLAAQEAIRGRGRLTQEGVRRQLERLGVQTQSPQAFQQTLLTVRQEMITRFEQHQAIMLRQQMPQFGAAPGIAPKSSADAEAEANRYLQGR